MKKYLLLISLTFFISVESIAKVKLNENNNEIISRYEVHTNSEKNKFSNKFHFHLGMSYNLLFGYNIRNNPPNFSKTNKLFNSGYSYSLESIYWIKPKTGVGMAYEYYNKQSNEVHEIHYPIYYYNERLRLNTFSLNIYRRLTIVNHKNNLLFNIGVNLSDYYTKVNNIIDYGYYKIYSDDKYTKLILGGELGASYERTITKHLNIGLRAQLKYSETNKVYIQIKDGEKEYTKLYDTDRINLSRASIGLYLCFY